MTIFPHQSSLSREERERIRREATLRRNTAWILDVAVGILRESPNCAQFSETEADVLLRELELVPRLEAALEQAERERDRALSIQRIANDRLADAEARLAKVPALVEALRALLASDSLVIDEPPEQVVLDAREALADWDSV